MAISELSYRFSDRKPSLVINDVSPQPQKWPSAEREPNKRSVAKKKWWAEKKAREKGE